MNALQIFAPTENAVAHQPSIDLNVLRPLLQSDKAVFEKGSKNTIAVYGLQSIYNVVISSLPFPEVGGLRGREFYTSEASRDQDWLMRDCLDHIDANRKRYKNKPDIVKALDALEMIATNYKATRAMIMANFTPAQCKEIRASFRETFGDPTWMIGIGGSWIDNVAEVVESKVRLIGRALKAKIGFVRPAEQQQISFDKHGL